MTAHFFVAPEQIAGNTVTLDADDSHHLVTVLRARPGLPATVADGSGTVWQAAFESGSDGEALLRLGDAEHVGRERPSITVVHALPKKRKLDEVVQRLTELGVDRIIPVSSTRSQVGLDARKAAKVVARWRAIALAAAKQSQRARLPIIDEVGDWITAFPRDVPGFIAWEESAVALRDVLETIPAGDGLVVGIGPEGGLTAEEITATGLAHASLGRTVLRTETAAIVTVAAMRYHFGLMGRA